MALCITAQATAQPAATDPMPSPQPPASASAAVTPLVCESAPGGGRQQCPADTSKGVALTRSTGSGECILGRNWGYDQVSIWVSEGCGGEFLVGAAAVAAAAQATAAPNGDEASDPLIETWGEFNPGTGFLVGRSSLGELAISGYGLVRYINQTPGEQEFTDHLGNTRPVDGRNDIYPHRVMVFFKGWLGTRKLIYSMTFWTVLDTSQNAIFTNVGYQFHRRFSLYAGLNGNPGTRSLQGNHPLWLGNDRVMADEFFRPFFGSGIWAQGEVVPGLWYNAMLSNTSSILDVKSSQLDREVDHRRVDVVDADDERVRPQGRLRRLGMARRRGDPVRRLMDAEPRAAVHRQPHGWSGKHHAQAGRQRERVRDRRAGRRRHGGHGGLPRSWRSMPA